jgi:hypothetical protein
MSFSDSAIVSWMGMNDKRPSPDIDVYHETIQKELGLPDAKINLTRGIYRVADEMICTQIHVSEIPNHPCMTSPLRENCSMHCFYREILAQELRTHKPSGELTLEDLYYVLSHPQTVDGTQMVQLLRKYRSQ